MTMFERILQPLHRHRRGVAQAAAAAALLALVSVAAWGVWRWATYPSAPDPETADLQDAIAFISGDDFNRLFQRHRRAFLRATIQGMGEQPFPELLPLMMQRDAGRRNLFRNIREIDGHEELAAEFYEMLLDRFYDQPKPARDVYLSMMVVAQQQGISRQARELGLPSEEQLKRSMTQFVTRQPPRVQALTSQFLLDLRRQREVLGYPEPWGP